MWLERIAERHFTREEIEAIQKRGGFEALLDELRQRLAEQDARHQGGSKWIERWGHPPLVPMATTPRASASARIARATAVP